MIHYAQKAEIRKRHKGDWRLLLFDRWGNVCWYHNYESFEGAREFVAHQVDLHAEMKRLKEARNG